MTAPVYGPFEVTVDAVYDLCPEADRVTDPNNSSLPTPITEATVARWIVELSGAAAAGIGDYDEFTGSTADTIKAGARAAVANGVASYLEAARYPAGAGLNESSYPAVLWARYESGVTALAAYVTAAAKSGEDVTPEEPGTGGPGGPFGANFPAPYFVDGDPYAPWNGDATCADPRAAW